MTILITGAGGYVGSILSKFLLEKKHNIIALDNYLTGHKSPLIKLQKKYGFSRLKILKLDLLKNNLKKAFSTKIDVVIHLASSSMVDESMKNPGKYFKNNLLISINLLEAMIRGNVDKIILASSSAVYGEAQYSPIDENHPTQPVNPYGESKLMIEKIVAWYEQIYGIQYVALRFFNICGAWEDGSLGDARNPSSAMIQNAVRGALNIEPFKLTFSKVDTKDRSPIRDYVDVVDVAQAISAATVYLLAKKNQSLILNIGSGVGHSVLEIVEIIQNIKKKEFPLNHIEPRMGEPAKVIADISLVKKYLNWQPQQKLSQSIKSLMNWYTLYPKGWQQND